MRGYARVSSAEQNLDPQIDAMMAAGVDREAIFIERSSGALSVANRPRLVMLLSALVPGDVLVVWRLDRLARDLFTLLTLLRDLEQRGVRILSLTDPIDTRTASGALVAQIFGALAQFERAQLRERQAAGIAARRRRGGSFGRPAALTPVQVIAARGLRAEGKTLREIARLFRVSRSPVAAAIAGLPPYAAGGEGAAGSANSSSDAP